MTIDNPTFFISLVNFVVRSLPEILVSLSEFFLIIIEISFTIVPGSDSKFTLF